MVSNLRWWLGWFIVSRPKDFRKKRNKWVGTIGTDYREGGTLAGPWNIETILRNKYSKPEVKYENRYRQLILKAIAIKVCRERMKQGHNNICCHKAVDKKISIALDQTLPGKNITETGLTCMAIMASFSKDACWFPALLFLFSLAHSSVSGNSWLPLLVNLHNGSKPVSSNRFVFLISLRNSSDLTSMFPSSLNFYN